MGTQFLNMLEAVCFTTLLILALIALDPTQVETEKVQYSEPTQGEITDACVDDYINEDWEVCINGEYK